jgi:hypothetical protein
LSVFPPDKIASLRVFFALLTCKNHSPLFMDDPHLIGGVAPLYCETPVNSEQGTGLRKDKKSKI